MQFDRLSASGKLVLVCALVLLFSVLPSAALIGTVYQMQLGNPSNATADPANHQHYLIQRTVEAMDYNDSLGEPNWVSWDLTAGDIGASGRSPSFFTDTTLPSGFYRVTEGDYSNSGYDRGHMCPSADRTDSTVNNDLVFYMSNIIPQAPDNNQGVWAAFETDCRTWAQAGNELLITCGPGGFNGSRIQPSGKVAIPAYTWKIAVIVPAGTGMAKDRITPATRVIAIKIPNTAGVRYTPWTSFVTSANQIQNETGYIFFTALPSEVARVLRYRVDGVPAPVITSFWPTNGGTGTTVTIIGTNLSSSSVVTFNGVDTSITANSTTQVVASVPAGASSGPVAIIAAGGLATTSNPFIVTGSEFVTIVAGPEGQTVEAGSSAVFSVQATGAEPLRYQWKKDGARLSDGGNIAGATLATLTIRKATMLDAGTYSVVVSNAFNVVSSGPAILRVLEAGPSVIAQWNFNSTNFPASNPPPSLGKGTATLVGNSTAAYVSGSGSSDPAPSNSAWNTTSYAAQGTGNKTRGVEFNVSTRGYKDIVLSWDQRVSGTASKYYRLQYSTNGTEFADANVVTINASSVFENQTNSLAGWPGIDNNPNFALRIVAEFESTALGTENANYVTASGSSYGTGGTARFDLVSVIGTAVPLSATLNVIPQCKSQCQVSVTGLAGERYAVEGSTNLLDWEPMVTNTVPFTFSAIHSNNVPARFFRAYYLP